MNWEAVGAIGEIFGAVAVLATLVYLAKQIRHNTLAMKAGAFRDATEISSDFTKIMLNDAELGKIFPKGLENIDSLDDDERLRFTLMLRFQLRRYETVYMQVEQGLLDRGTLVGMETAFAQVFSNKSAEEYWRSERHNFLPAYVKVVDELLGLGGDV